MDAFPGIIISVISIVVITFIYTAGKVVSENEIRWEMHECMQLKNDAEKCYNFVILNKE